MKKNKDGNVIASLTEVKNKTGDIFALADEFGEVILTSYNKPRYKLIKLQISSLLDEESDAPKPKKSKPVKKAEDEIHTENPVEAAALLDKTFIINEWDRDSAAEQELVAKITKNLI